MKKMKNRKRAGIKGYIIVVLLSLFFIISSNILYQDLDETDGNFTYKLDDIRHKISLHDYSEAVMMIRNNQNQESEPSKESEELLYFAECCDILPVYIACLKGDSKDKIQPYQDIFEENEKKLTDEQLKAAIADYKENLEALFEEKKE